MSSVEKSSAFSSFYYKHDGEYSKLLQARINGHSVSKGELDAAEATVKTAKIASPFLYEIKRPAADAAAKAQLVGYLIGTRHLISKQMMDTPLFQRVIAASSQVFGEEPFEQFIIKGSIATALKTASDLMPSIYKDLSTCDVPMDLMLYKYALDQDIPYRGLPKIEEIAQRKAHMESILYNQWSSPGRPDKMLLAFKNTSSSDLSPIVIERDLPIGSVIRYKKTTSTERDIEELEFYQKGSTVELFNRIHSQFYDLDKIIFEPNRRWCSRTILPALAQVKMGEKPVCVAVGVCHLMGRASEKKETSIIKILRENGFDVTRITDIA